MACLSGFLEEQGWSLPLGRGVRVRVRVVEEIGAEWERPIRGQFVRSWVTGKGLNCPTGWEIRVVDGVDWKGTLVHEWAHALEAHSWVLGDVREVVKLGNAKGRFKQAWYRWAEGKGVLGYYGGVDVREGFAEGVRQYYRYCVEDTPWDSLRRWGEGDVEVQGGLQVGSEGWELVMDGVEEWLGVYHGLMTGTIKLPPGFIRG